MRLIKHIPNVDGGLNIGIGLHERVMFIHLLFFSKIVWRISSLHHFLFILLVVEWSFDFWCYANPNLLLNFTQRFSKLFLASKIYCFVVIHYFDPIWMIHVFVIYLISIHSHRTPNTIVHHVNICTLCIKASKIALFIFHLTINHLTCHFYQILVDFIKNLKNNH